MIRIQLYKLITLNIPWACFTTATGVAKVDGSGSAVFVTAAVLLLVVEVEVVVLLSKVGTGVAAVNDKSIIHIPRVHRVAILYYSMTEKEERNQTKEIRCRLWIKVL